METMPAATSSIRYAREDLRAEIAVVENRAKRASRWASRTMALTAGFGIVAAYHAFTTPAAVPSITELALPAEVLKAIGGMSSYGSGSLPFDSVTTTMADGLETAFKGVAVLAFIVGMAMGVIRQSITAIVLPIGFLLAAFSMPFVLDTVAPELKSSTKREITIECVSKRSCISVLNTAAPMGTASRHFINAQLYAYGGRQDSVMKELSALRSTDGGAEIENSYAPVMAALAVAAGEPLTPAQVSISALAAKQHSDKRARMNGMLVGAGLWGMATLVLGGFGIFLRRRVSTVRAMLRPQRSGKPTPKEAITQDIKGLDVVNLDGTLTTIVATSVAHAVEPHQPLRHPETDWD